MINPNELEDLTSFEWEILNKLGEAEFPLSSRQIAMDLERNLDYTSRKLKSLANRKVINRLPGAGHSYTYTLPRKKLAVKLHYEDDIVKITSGDLLKHLQAWSQEPWRPKIFKHAVLLPYVLANLYEAAVNLSYGANVTNKELKENRELLNDLKLSLENTLRIVNGVIKRRELWDTATLPQFLLSRGGEIDMYRQKAQQMKDLNVLDNE